MHKKIQERRMGVLEDNQQDLINKYGWVVHCVFETEERELNGLANIHTHGLQENYNHPDLQIVLPISPEIAHPVLSGVVDQIKDGAQFSVGKSSNILRDMDALLIEKVEGGRKVLRIVLPDARGNFPGDSGCDHVYNHQLDNLPQ